jgi:hypothetical protein
MAVDLEGVQHSYDGGYIEQRAIEAAEAIAALVRNLNKATGEPGAMLEPPILRGILSPIAAATSGLEQLLQKVNQCLQLTAANVDDRRDRPSADTIDEVAAELAGARVAARVLVEHLNRAARHASHVSVQY